MNFSFNIRIWAYPQGICALQILRKRGCSCSTLLRRRRRRFLIESLAVLCVRGLPVHVSSARNRENSLFVSSKSAPSWNVTTASSMLSVAMHHFETSRCVTIVSIMPIAFPFPARFARFGSLLPRGFVGGQYKMQIADWHQNHLCQKHDTFDF